MNNLKISTKLYGLVVGIIVIFASAMIATMLYDHANLEAERKAGLASLNDAAISVLQHYYDASQRGEFAAEDAQALALNAIRDMRYKGDGYFFIIDTDGVMVMHPTSPQLEGDNQLGLQDVDGKYIFREMIDIAAEQGHGAVDYKWPKPGLDEPVLKFTQVDSFKQWGWVVGTGVYADDLSALFWKNARTVLSIIAAVIAVAGVVSFTLIRSIVRPLQSLRDAIGEIAKENTDVEITSDARRDEIGEISEAVAVLRDSVIERKELRVKQVEQQQQLDQERATTEEERQQHAKEVQHAADAQAQAIELLGAALERLADGQLDNHIDLEFAGELDRVRQAFNRTVEQFSEIVVRLRQTSRGVKTATGEILAGANDLSERTTKQAATIEETSAAMEQLATTVMENAKRAGSASEQAKSVSQTAEEGGEVMSRANQAMERITQSSAKISNIIGMIDEISFQTNLLALNASVEAARAGEAGKGFAVVAVEVRRLAQSAAEASSQVKTQIEQSGEEVSGGARLVAEAAEKLASMREAVKFNASQMEDIAKDSREQASAIEEVNVAVRQMDEMTQHNAALVEETNAAIEQTEAQASELDRIVDAFSLDHTDAETKATATSDARARPVVKNDKASRAARSYLSQGSTALKEDSDWSEF